MKRGTFSAAAVLVAALAAAGQGEAAEPMRQPVLLGGKPFPRVERYRAPMPEPRRTVSLAAGEDLQKAILALEPGDRLRVAKGTYAAVAIDAACRAGTRELPIQIVFERDAVIVPAAGATALTIRQPNWQISGALLRLGDSAAAGISIESSAVSIDATQISGGAGPGVRVARGAANVTISNCILSKRNVPKPAVAGIEIESGTSDIVVTHNRFHVHRAGSIRIGAAPANAKPARNIRLTANTIRDDGATAILAARADALHIADNTLFAARGAADTRGIDLREVERAVVRSNQLSDFAVAIAAGRVDPVVHAAREITLAHNHLETRAGSGIGVALEAGSAIRFANNVVNGYADAILLLGRRPALSQVTVANNLVLGVSRTAFVIRDPAVAALFDFNVFSPLSPVEVEVNGTASPLAAHLQRAMPNSRIARVMMFDHDLARLGGIETVDRGVAVAGLPFDGKAPDLGVAER